MQHRHQLTGKLGACFNQFQTFIHSCCVTSLCGPCLLRGFLVHRSTLFYDSTKVPPSFHSSSMSPGASSTLHGMTAILIHSECFDLSLGPSGHPKRPSCSPREPSGNIASVPDTICNSLQLGNSHLRLFA